MIAISKPTRREGREVAISCGQHGGLRSSVGLSPITSVGSVEKLQVEIVRESYIGRICVQSISRPDLKDGAVLGRMFRVIMDEGGGIVSFRRHSRAFTPIGDLLGLNSRPMVVLIQQQSSQKLRTA